jgi:hypothetical protein
MQAAASLGAAVLAALVARLGGGGHQAPARRATAVPAPVAVPNDPVSLAVTLAATQRTIDGPTSSAAELRAASRAQQLATVVLARGNAAKRRSVLARLSGAAAAALRANLAADPRAFYGYYYWQVILAQSRGLVILPVGFPRQPAVPVGREGG